VPALPKEQRDELNLGLVARQKTGDRFALPLGVELLALQKPRLEFVSPHTQLVPFGLTPV
jgi:hypothetical protein